MNLMLKLLSSCILRKKKAVENEQKLNCAISVVIATLGGIHVQKTIERLNKGSLIPDEILICIPQREALKAAFLKTTNVKIIVTEVRGQVAQRAIGFENAKNPLVLQLDDDILLRDNCLEELVATMGERDNAAIGPKLYDVRSGLYHSFLIPSVFKYDIFNKIFFWIINGRDGFIPGLISRSGLNMGIPEGSSDFVGIDWLPGGCILHRKKNLVTYNFYPFKGKAFAEDLFHSNILRKKNIILIRAGRALCDVDFFSNHKFSFRSAIAGQLAYAKAMKKLNDEANRSSCYFYFYLFLNGFRVMAKKIEEKRLKLLC